VFVDRVELMTPPTERALDARLRPLTLRRLTRIHILVFVNELRRRGKANAVTATRAVIEELFAKTAREYRSPS
jgi:hypothetical protein